MYSKKVLDVFQDPKHVGELKDANAVGQAGNEACGDIMKVYLKINDKEVIENASFKAFGCAAAIASSSVAMDKIIGKTISEALAIDSQSIIDELGGLPSHKVHCGMLAKEAISAAVDDYRKRQARLAKRLKKQLEVHKKTADSIVQETKPEKVEEKIEPSKVAETKIEIKKDEQKLQAKLQKLQKDEASRKDTQKKLENADVISTQKAKMISKQLEKLAKKGQKTALKIKELTSKLESLNNKQ